MKQAASAVSHSMRELSLTRKVVGLALLLGTAVWLGIDYLVTRDLEGVFLETVTNDLEGQAVRDRHAFDRKLQRHHRAARLITSQTRFIAHVAGVNWSEESAPLITHRQPPRWMPESSVLRSFYDARFAVLLDNEGKARETFSLLPTPLPKALLAPSTLLQKLSHNQSYLTEIEEMPYAVAAEPFDNGGTRGTLLLASPIDEEFLRGVARVTGHDTYLALLGGEPRRVISSNYPRGISPGTDLGSLQVDFLITGKSFFDYGAADLDAQFTSLLPRSTVEQRMNAVLSKEQHRRVWLTAALLLPFIALMYGVARQIRNLAEEVDSLAVATLGHHAFDRFQGDELSGLMTCFRAFSSELVAARDALRAELRTKLLLERKAVEAEERAQHTRHLRAVTEALQVGVIVEHPNGPTSANAIMDGFVKECGGIDAFLVDTGTDSVVIHLEDATDRERVFRIRRPAEEAEQTLLVRDITEEVQLDRERRLFAFMPAESPNPVLRVDGQGCLRYANRASEPLLAEWGLGIDAILPRSLRDGLQCAMHSSGNGTFELSVGERHYQFFVARIEESEFIYLYGSDITGSVQAEASINALNRRLGEHVEELIRVNRDLEAFSYSVSHDLRGPLRTIDGFSHLILHEHADQLSDTAKHDLQRIRTAVAHMNGLMDGLLKLSRVSRSEPQIGEVDLSAMAQETVAMLQQRDPERCVEFVVEEGLVAPADASLMQVAMENLLGNAWKFTSGRETARIHFGTTEVGGKSAYYVRDNGAGFKMAHAGRLFGAFERLHEKREFPGHGIGLATVSRIIQRHGGRIWAEAEPDRGATFYFTLTSSGG